VPRELGPPSPLVEVGGEGLNGFGWEKRGGGQSRRVGGAMMAAPDPFVSIHHRCKAVFGQRAAATGCARQRGRPARSAAP
jgi:hypothetical protein